MTNVLACVLIVCPLLAAANLFARDPVARAVARQCHVMAPPEQRQMMTFSLPAGTKMFYVNISDSADNIISTRLVTLGGSSSAEPAHAERIHFDTTVWIPPRIFDDVPDSLDYPGEEAFYYAGLDYQGRKTKVFAYAGFPLSASLTSKVPGVVLAHGGGGTAFPHWVKLWNDEGYAAIAMDLEGHQPTVPDPPSLLLSDHMMAGPSNVLFADTNKRIEDQWLYHAVADVYLAYSILASDPRVDKNSIGITGISWGAIVTSIAVGNADCFAFAIPVYGCAYLNTSKALYRNLYSDTVTRLWDASKWLRFIHTPTLWINGESDPIFSLDATTKTARATSNASIAIIPGLRHSHVDGWGPREIYTFANSVVRGEKRLVKILKHPAQDDLTVDIDATEGYGIKSAVLNFSLDTLSYDEDGHANTVWHRTPIETANLHR